MGGPIKGDPLWLSQSGYYPKLVVDGNQRDLPAVIDIGDLNLELVADVDDVLDLLDALLATELRDVHEPIAVGKD